MSRLPIPGADQGQWGQILNDFLLREHQADGSLKIRADLAAKANDSEVIHTTGGARDSYITAPGGSAYSISLNAANLISLTLSAASCILTFPSVSSGLSASFTLELIQDATGNRVVVWPTSVKWPGGIAPVLSTAAGALDVFSFYTINGGVSWRGFLSGANVQ